MDSLGEDAEVPSSAACSLRRVERSAILKAPLFFAVQTLYPKRTEALVEDDIGKALVTILRPGLFASFLYAHRRFNKIIPASAWSSLSKE